MALPKKRIDEMVVNLHTLQIPITKIALASKLTEEETLSIVAEHEAGWCPINLKTRGG